MSSSSSNEPGPRSEPPGATSAVRPAGGRSTLPGPGPGDAERVTHPDGPHTLPGGHGPPADPSAEVELDSSDLERASLLDLPAVDRYGSYELLGRIAYGGMAEIFLAREVGRHDTRRMLVVKRVLPHVAEDPHFVDMFIDEARLAMQLNHPNICHVYNFGEAEGTYYIAMEWVNGKPLSKIIRRARERGGLPIPVALKIVAQVAEALDYAHRASDASGEPLGIVHRDVSPQNIMVSYDGVVKLLDFGIAKATSHSTRTEAGVIKGKFAYMSPQQCVGEPIDARADIFALGICLFEALAGKNPFRRKTEFETMTKIVGDPTPRVRDRRPEVPEAIEAVLDRALQKAPEERYQSAGEMQLALETELPKLGELVNASRLGEYVAELFADEVRDGPRLDVRLSTPPKQARSGVSEERSEEAPRQPRPGSTELDAAPVPEGWTPPSEAEAAAPPKRSAMGAVAAVAVGLFLLGLAGAGGLLAWSMLGGDAPPARRAADPRPPTPPAAAEPPGENRVAAAGGAAEGEAQGEAPTAGSVFLESVPPGATIALGDRDDVGTTPLEMGMIEPGTYDVRLTLEGHEAWEGQVTVRAGERATVTAELERARRRRPAARPPGELSLNTRPWSKVYLGRRLLGTTPLGRVAVPSGTHRLRLVDRDGREHRRTVRVPAGGHVTESYRLRE
jgi:serine/threonine-protein kinase